MHVRGGKIDGRKKVPLCFRELLCIIFSERIFHEPFETMSDESLS